MDSEELKRKLMGLWEKTTHNSKDLLSILFDYYFDIKYLEYKELEGKVVCALCGIPYTFRCGENALNGIYIIAMTSEEGYRKKGILAELLNNFNFRMKEEFDFSFILHHTELLADYYGSLGYLSSFYVLEQRYTPLHDFKNEYFLSLTDSDERIKALKGALWDEIRVSAFNSETDLPKSSIIKFIQENERRNAGALNLSHTYRDIEYILEADSLRKLSPFIAYDGDGKISGVAFAEKEDFKKVKVVAMYVADSCSYFMLLEEIKLTFPDCAIAVNTSDPKNVTQAIMGMTYASENKNGDDLDNTFSFIEMPFNFNKLLQPLGMAKILKFEGILKYIAASRKDVDFKLCIRSNREDEETGTDGENGILYIVKDGKCNIEKKYNLQNDKSLLALTPKEVSELLLRKNDSSNLIMEAFGIPRLNLQMKLLPY